MENETKPKRAAAAEEELTDEELRAAAGGHKSSKGDTSVLEFASAEPKALSRGDRELENLKG